MDTQTLILTITGAALVPFLGWMGTTLFAIKSQQAVIIEKINHLSNNHDELSTWVEKLDTYIKDLQHEITILKTITNDRNHKG